MGIFRHSTLLMQRVEPGSTDLDSATFVVRPADGDGAATDPSPRVADDDLSRLLDDVHALSDDEAHALLSNAGEDAR